MYPFSGTETSCPSVMNSGVSGTMGQSTWKLTAWNCRGLLDSLPYIGALLDDSSSIIILAEHWLWPYKLMKLAEINERYEAIGKADKWLTEDADSTKDYGRIGMLLPKCVGAIPICYINSDRVRGIN